MKLICEYPVGTLRNATSTNNLQSLARSLKNMPGVGKPFLVFESLPGPVTTVIEWPAEYVVSSDELENLGMINAMIANPPLSSIVI